MGRKQSGPLIAVAAGLLALGGGCLTPDKKPAGRREAARRDPTGGAATAAGDGRDAGHDSWPGHAGVGHAIDGDACAGRDTGPGGGGLRGHRSAS